MQRLISSLRATMLACACFVLAAASGPDNLIDPGAQHGLRLRITQPRPVRHVWIGESLSEMRIDKRARDRQINGCLE